MRDFLVTFTCLCFVIFIGQNTIWKCSRLNYSEFAEYKKADCVKGDLLIEQAIFEQINDGKTL